MNSSSTKSDCAEQRAQFRIEVVTYRSEHGKYPFIAYEKFRDSYRNSTGKWTIIVKCKRIDYDVLNNELASLNDLKKDWVNWMPLDERDHGF